MCELIPELFPLIFDYADIPTRISLRFTCRAFHELLPRSVSHIDKELFKRWCALCNLYEDPPSTRFRKFNTKPKEPKRLAFLSFMKACCLKGYTNLFLESLVFTCSWQNAYMTDSERARELQECYQAAILGGSLEIFMYFKELCVQPTEESIFLCAKYQRQEIAAFILEKTIVKCVDWRSRILALPDKDWLPPYYNKLSCVTEQTLMQAIEYGNYELIPKLIRPKFVTWEHVIRAKYMQTTAPETYQLLLSAAYREGQLPSLTTIMQLDDVEFFSKCQKTGSWKLAYVPQVAVIHEAYKILSFLLQKNITKKLPLLNLLQLLDEEGYTLKDRNLVAYVARCCDLPALSFLQAKLGPFLEKIGTDVNFHTSQKLVFSNALLDFFAEHMPKIFHHTNVQVMLIGMRIDFLYWLKEKIRKDRQFIKHLPKTVVPYADESFLLDGELAITVREHDLEDCIEYAICPTDSLLKHNSLRCIEKVLSLQSRAFLAPVFAYSTHPRTKQFLKERR